MARSLWRLAWLPITLLAVSCNAPEDVPVADIAVVNARVHSFGQAGGVEAGGVCIKADRIMAVGGERDIASCIGPQTWVIDAGERTVLPGLIDSHMHIFSGSIAEQPVNLSKADSMPLLIRALETIRDNDPDAEVIVARGWQNHIFPPEGPRASLLDKIFGDRPVIIRSVDGHSTWFSSAAFAAAGADADTPDPMPGVSFFERDPETGVLLGTAREGAGQFIQDALVKRTRAEYRAAVERWQPRALDAGLTGVFDAGMAAPSQADGYAILGNLSETGDLRFRVFSSVYAAGQLYKGPDAGTDPLALLASLRKEFSNTLVTPTSVKVFVDGTPEGHTSYLLTPYEDDPETVGKPMLTQEKLDALVLRGQRAGVPIHMHAIGGAAVRMALDAVEAAQAESGHQDVRHAIAHMDFVSEADIARFADLNVIAQTSIQWAARDPSYDSLSAYVGADRMEAAYPVRGLIDAGAVQTFGTDWPATTYLSTFNPFDMIEMAVTRRLPGVEDGPARNADQRLTVEQAVRAMTQSVAYQLGVEDELGSLEIGKKADLIILSQDIFGIPVHRIHKTRAMLTIVDGRVVYNTLGRDELDK